MKCEECQYLFSRYIDGEIGERGRALTEDHLATCVSCHEMFDELTMLVKFLSALDRPLPPLTHPEHPLSSEIDKEFGASNPLRVFLCHSFGDKASVRTLYKRLLGDGVKPWLDEEDLLPGQEWEYEVQKALRKTDVVIVCLSRTSIRKKGFVQKEIRIALDIAMEQPEGGIFLIPLRLEECDVPANLCRFHWVNYFEEQGYDKLRSALKHCAGVIRTNDA